MLCWLLYGGAIALFCALYHRGLPLMFHVRVAALIVSAFLRPRPLTSLTQEIVEHDRVSLADMDFNMHMNNAVYNSLTDFSRIRFFLRLSKKPVSFLRKFRIANGGLSMYFIRELRFNQSFRIRTRVIGMDRKWLIFAHIFESPNGKRLHAFGTSKIVFKKLNGQTIPPRDFFSQHCGLAVPDSMAEDSPHAAHLHNLMDELYEVSGHELPAPGKTPVPTREDAEQEDAARK